MSDRKLTFFTSDWHIGHERSIELDSRPFQDIDHMHKVLVNNYNATVPKDGVCYFLGDIGLSSTSKTKEIISQLNGTKVLVVGNHDKGYNAMYNCGFDLVINAAVLYIAGRRVTLSHCPLKGVFREDVTGMKNAMPSDHWHGEHKNNPYTVSDEGQFHLHGHIHSSPKNGKPKIDGKQYDIGVPHNNYRPVSISVIEAWISKCLKVEDTITYKDIYLDEEYKKDRDDFVSMWGMRYEKFFEEGWKRCRNVRIKPLVEAANQIAILKDEIKKLTEKQK